MPNINFMADAKYITNMTNISRIFSCLYLINVEAAQLLPKIERYPLYFTGIRETLY